MEPQMVFLWWRHAGADYHLQYLCADVATLRHALIKKPLASVARSWAFDNTVCLFMWQVLATAYCLFSVTFCVFYISPVDYSLYCLHCGSDILFGICGWHRNMRWDRGLLGYVVVVLGSGLMQFVQACVCLKKLFVYKFSAVAVCKTKQPQALSDSLR